jgi:hypothetical protein
MPVPSLSHLAADIAALAKPVGRPARRAAAQD